MLLVLLTVVVSMTPISSSIVSRVVVYPRALGPSLTPDLGEEVSDPIHLFDTVVSYIPGTH